MPIETIRWDNRGKPIKVENPINQLYDSVEFTIATGITDYDLDAQQSAAFSNILTWMSCVIRTDKTITIRLNSATNPIITINDYESPFHLKTEMEITNIYITNNSGGTASIKILAFNRTYGHG